jgi:Zn-finger nucleic acid-binding protein
MTRCPMCRSALVTITFGLYPTAICTNCSARWIQDGHQQRAINQIQEPTLFASAQGPSLSWPKDPRSWPPVAPSQASTPTLTRAHIATPAPAS